MEHNALWWIGFNALVIVLIMVDMLVFHKRDHEVSIKESLIWTAVWITLALLFNVFILLTDGRQQALDYLTGYLIEKSLSVDNLFVFIVIFSYFRVPAVYQHRVLFYGILVAMILRAAFILAGIKLVTEFEWIMYIFGAFLIYIAIKMVAEKNEEYDPSKNLVVKLFSKIMPMKMEYKNHNFIEKENGKRHLTQLFVVLVTISFVDLVFAVDSIPAIFAITTDPFIVYTSNIFAIMGLRALYFAIAGVMKLFHYLKYALSVILAFVGVKMLIAHYFKIPTGVSLLVIVSVLTIAILASVLRSKIMKNTMME
ncbi:MAG: Inner membrane protein alx [Candidatus Aerophobetes bacterium ADurb.Bin490]|nr:MAG: Inner membrane protein alx [Candidatus Aerophobetes bacterium ADurb.Bin490]HPI02553.1 TerC family protein [Candidatus Goldiibacteriota bacterium]HPN63880.1 TerC family protein [Candidatus Goldiibacteriota bacterium]HRQ42929.1 TerC family protein [Candidatus Goldiibacteriota bacterium]